MARIFNFKTEKRRLKLYEEMVKGAGDFLDKTVSDLVTLAVNIAVSDAWDEWDKEQPLGTSFYFSTEVLLSCPDENVRRLARIIEHIENPRIFYLFIRRKK